MKLTRLFLIPLFLVTFIDSLAQAKPYQNSTLSGTEYFSLFNYQDTSRHERIKSFENELTVHADRIVEFLSENPDYEEVRTRVETPVSNLGLILVYTGMFILNNNNAILEGVFNERAFGEIGSRYAKAQAYLNLALKLVPEDDRIHSWAVANELRAEKVKTGSVSNDILDEVMGLVRKNPIFHLFNALTMSSDVDFGAEREAELLKYAEKMDSKDSPCWPPIFRRGEAKQCKTTKKTPFAFQGVTTYLGDEFLKTSMKLQASNPEKAKEYAEKALSDYQRLNFFLFKRKTNRWPQKSNLEERVKVTQEFIQTGVLRPNYLKSRSFLNIYTCTSCHQGGVAPTKLFVNLIGRN